MTNDLAIENLLRKAADEMRRENQSSWLPLVCDEAAAEIERLSAEVAAADLRTGAASKVALELGEQRDRLKEAAGTYFERYCQDEADDVEHCVCGEQQHQDAIALCQALKDAP